MACGRDLLGAFERAHKLSDRLGPGLQAIIQDPTLLELISRPPPLFHLLEAILGAKSSPEAVYSILRAYSSVILGRLKSAEVKELVEKVRTTYRSLLSTNKGTGTGDTMLSLHRSACVDLPATYSRLSERAKNDIVAAFQARDLVRLVRKREPITYSSPILTHEIGKV
jgi:hypothetical protein